VFLPRVEKAWMWKRVGVGRIDVGREGQLKKSNDGAFGGRD